MARLPKPGGDDGNWGDILNAFLATAHNSDGTPKDIGVIANKYVLPGGGIPEDHLSGAVQTKLNAATTDASDDTKGVIQLSGDLGGTATSPTVPGLASKAEQADLENHFNDATGSHAASSISVVPTGPLTDNNTQDALENVFAVTATQNERLDEAEERIDEIGSNINSWHDVLAGMHSYDAADAVLYESDGAYGESPVRVDYIPDQGTTGTHPLVRDEGVWANLWDNPTVSPGPIPGPLYAQSSPIFGGRPAWICDDLGYVWTNAFALGHNAHSGLTTSADPTDSAQFFNTPTGYGQPYTVMSLCRIHDEGGIAIDTISGGPTVGSDDTANEFWGVTTDFGKPWPNTTHPLNTDQTVLFIVRMNGANSWLEIVSRDENGQIVRDRQNIVLSAQTPPDPQYRNIWLGMIHATSFSTLKVVDGEPSDADLDKVVAWASPYIPSVGPIPYLDSAVGTYYKNTGGLLSGDLLIKNGVGIAFEDANSTERFKIDYFSFLGSHSLVIRDTVNATGLASFAPGTAGNRVMSVQDKINMVRGSGAQTANMLEFFQENGLTVMHAITATGANEFYNQTDPAAPSASRIRLYGKNDGGTTELFVRRNAGVADKVVTQGAIITDATAARGLTLTDAGDYIRLTNGTSCGVTVPTNASVAFPINTRIYLRSAGAGTYTVIAAGGVTVNPPKGGSLVLDGDATLIKVATNEWDLLGDTV